MKVPQMKSLEEENARFKKLLTEDILDKETLQATLDRKF
jgi:putative transposase